ncbi:MAG: sugar ABC transporter ATP-binding protein [Verrucomicrobiales bacterium]|nr:sugar ABC transporter ATP-binding protein [Verrucomicrobiales bacterium]
MSGAIESGVLRNAARQRRGTAAPGDGESSSTQPSLLVIDQVGKRFGRTEALKEVSLRIDRGRVYGLAGENGAGKSTLIKILGGVHRSDGGRITLGGRPFAPGDPGAAEAAGIHVFHQEIPICPNLSVATNVFLGRRGRGGLAKPRVDEAECRRLFRELLDLELDPRRLMRDCTAAERQLALLVRVLWQRADLIILDEPTTALTPPEVARLFAIIQRLKSQGVAFLFVSHLLEEMLSLADEIFVLRDGALAGHLGRDAFDAKVLARMIAGRTLEKPSGGTRRIDGPPRLEVSGLSRGGEFLDVSFRLQPGEVLGVTGLQGSGRSAVLRALFGAPPASGGEVRLDGSPVRVSDPQRAMAAGIGYVPEDRRQLGLFDDLDVQRNLGLLKLDELSRGGRLRFGRLRELAVSLQRRLGIRMAGPDAAIGTLSGGNQQKVLIARWLAIRPRLLLMQEPTRGVDVGAKEEICRLIRELAGEGCAFVVSSSELEELIAVSDRILVFRAGRVGAEFARGAVTKADLIHACAQPGALSPFPNVADGN